MSGEYEHIEIITFTLCTHKVATAYPPKLPSYSTEEEIKIRAKCPKCRIDDIRGEVAAIEYLNRKMIEEFLNSPVERFRRWSHNALHRAQYAMGHTYCWACNELTHNRLRPMSHQTHEPPA